MSNTTNTKSTTPVAENNKGLVVVFQEFNGVFLAKITNKKDKETHAFGKTKSKAQLNALTNFRRKYYSTFQNL